VKNSEHIARIAGEAAAKVAAEKAAEVAIEVYERQKNKDAKRRIDRRLRNTKLLLNNYRSFVAHVDNAVYDIEQATEDSAIRILDMIESYDGAENMTIESIMRTTARTAVIISHIEQMLNIYRTMCEKSVNSEDIRRYRVIKSLYMDVTPMSINELSEAENVVAKTIYRDRNIAFERLAALFFGIDGMQKLH
jgi:flavin-dependent dehydrogenase